MESSDSILTYDRKKNYLKVIRYRCQAQPKLVLIKLFYLTGPKTNKGTSRGQFGVFT